MTPAQKKVLDAVERLISEKGYSPSYEEIAVACDLHSIASIYEHVTALIARGHLYRRGPKNSSRCLSLVPPVEGKAFTPPVCQTRTFALFAVEKPIYDYIRDGLEKAGYAHAFIQQDDGIVIDMNGIALKSL